jgi:hypothetical protein
LAAFLAAGNIIMQLLRQSVYVLAFALIATCATAIAATPVPAFTAHYRLLRNGSPIGTATVTLASGSGNTWTYTTASRGTAGLASLLGANIKEQSTFQWAGDLPQGDSYDYSMDTALKQKHRTVQFNWNAHTVEVNDHGVHRFPTQPGALERHTVPLALIAGLQAGKATFALPVAVRDRIQLQHYSVRGHQKVTVPAGTFQATDITRTDGGDPFEVWFAPAQLPVPVKLDQRGKDEFSLELESWEAH